MLSDGTHKVLATLSSKAMSELEAFETRVAKHCILAIKGDVVCKVAQDYTEVELFLDDAPMLVISDVK